MRTCRTADRRDRPHRTVVPDPQLERRMLGGFGCPGRVAPHPVRAQRARHGHKPGVDRGRQHSDGERSRRLSPAGGSHDRVRRRCSGSTPRVGMDGRKHDHQPERRASGRRRLAHEAKHADQWALLKPLGFLQTWLLSSGVSYATTGTYACGNFIEIWADLEDGGYDECLELGVASK